MSPAAEDPQSSAHQLADHLFRHESGKMVAVLAGIYGTRNLQLAEDVVQEALVRALVAWPFGIPANPSAWLLRTAKNLAIDHLRRERNFLGKQPEIIAEMETRAAPDPVFIDDAQRTEAHELRVIIVGEAEAVEAVEPTVIGVAAGL